MASQTPETDRESGARAWPQLQVSRGVKGPMSAFPEKKSLLWLGSCFSLASPAQSVFRGVVASVFSSVMQIHMYFASLFLLLFKK